MFTFTRKYSRVLVMLSICASMASCQTLSEATDIAENSVLPAPETIIYTIKKGAHTSTNNSFKTLKTNKLRFDVTFDSTAIYTSAKPENQFDINKLYGISDCSSHHQVNSARVGWRWSNNQLELHAYTYKGGSRKSAYITSITLGKAALCELALEEGKYSFNVNGIRVELPRGCSGSTDAYQLYPYFGGDETAPHDITISIRDK